MATNDTLSTSKHKIYRMKYVKLLLVLFASTTLFAQTPGYPTLQVTGKSEMDVMPDVGILTLSISEIKMEFNDALSALDKKTSKVKKQLSKLNFSEEEIKTRSFQIRKNTIYNRNQRKDSGYVASQSIIVEFKYSKERISELLSDFAEESVGMQLSFAFTLSEELKSETKNKLISMASKDAQQKASLLASNFGKELDKIVNLNYGTAPIQVSNPIYRTASMGMDEMASKAYISGFTPESIKLTETVHASWSLK